MTDKANILEVTLALKFEYLKRRNFGGFVKNLTSRQNYNFSPSAKLNSRQNYNFSTSDKIKFPPKLVCFAIRQIKFPPKLSFFAIRQIKFPPKLVFCPSASSIYPTVDYRYFEHCAISNKSLKNMKTQRMRDKNSSLFISLLKLVNFNNTYALLLYFFLCQDTFGKMFISIR